MDFYNHRIRHLSEIFPWDHIGTGVSRQFLEREYAKSLRGELTSDCRDGCHACGIIPLFGDQLSAHPEVHFYCPETAP